MVDQVAAASASSAISSSTSSKDVEEVFSPESRSYNPGDTCGWYSGIRCGQPRTCYDCLNQAVGSDKCVVESSGNCNSLSEEYLAMYPSNYYSSTNYSYCEVDDANCSVCKERWNSMSYVPYEACTGTNGCVCIAVCEVDTWKLGVLKMFCDEPRYIKSSSQTTKIVIAAYISLIVLSLLISVVFLVKRCFQTIDNYPVNSQRSANSRSTRRDGPLGHRVPQMGPILGLGGWKSMREKLIQNENSEVMGTTLQQGEASFVDAPAIIVEQGDSYRRMPPNRMTSYDQVAITDNDATATTTSVAGANTSTYSTDMPRQS